MTSGWVTGWPVLGSPAAALLVEQYELRRLSRRAWRGALEDPLTVIAAQVEVVEKAEAACQRGCAS